MGIKELLKLTDEEVKKPLPKPSKWSRPFWDAAKQHKLVLKKCKDCGHIDHPPYLYCTNCLSDNSEWIEAAGRAKLYAYAINEYNVPFPFWDDMPYVVAMVDLAEGVRMISNIIECPHDSLKNGMELEVVFDDLSPEFTLPKWRPAKG
jgi:uncharacterized OB-fold protein